MSVIEKKYINNQKQTLFYDPNGAGIARYDQIKYKVFDRLTRQQKGFFWQPEEIDLQKDSKDFKDLTSYEQHIFTSNIKRQILLDSVQGRAPALAFLPVCTLPELEQWIIWWTASEGIHSDSYTHIIRNVYNDPSKIFDDIMNISEIVNCAKDISLYYDSLIEKNQSDCPLYDKKKALWLALNAVNALEGVRFYVSFACSWAFAELKKMEGNAKIIKLICRDENIHLASTQLLLKLLPKEDVDFLHIRNDNEQNVINIFNSVINQEKAWAEYLFKDGSMIGLNTNLLCNYVDYIAKTRMENIGIISHSKKENPLPWTAEWISGKETQVTPQETEITSYTLEPTKMDINKSTFEGFIL